MLHYNEQTKTLSSDSLVELRNSLWAYAGGSATNKMEIEKDLERWGHAVSVNGCEIIWTKKCNPRYMRGL